MAIVSYAEALKAGKKKVDEMLIPTRVRRARKQAELEMCRLEEEIAEGESSLQRMCMQEEINFASIISLQDKIALLNRKREQYAELIEKMFPEGEA